MKLRECHREEEGQAALGRAHKNKKGNNKKKLMLTKAQFNIHEVEHYGDEENSLEDLRKAGCTNILVLLRDHDRGFIRVACDLPERRHPPGPTQIEVRLFMTTKQKNKQTFNIKIELAFIRLLS